MRRYYSTPCVSHLIALSSNELAGLADLLEGRSQDERLDCRSMIELLGWSDGLRSLVTAVGLDYTPLPLPEGTKPTFQGSPNQDAGALRYTSLLPRQTCALFHRPFCLFSSKAGRTSSGQNMHCRIRARGSSRLLLAFK